MLASAKRLINHGLRPLGHVVAHEPCVPSGRRFFATLRANGLTPQTVFDIGVAQGTPWLYDAFPDAFYYLVDPTRESLPHMRRWAQRLRAEVVNVALGASAGTAVIDVRDEIGGSTFFREVGPHVSVANYAAHACIAATTDRPRSVGGVDRAGSRTVSVVQRARPERR